MDEENINETEEELKNENIEEEPANDLSDSAEDIPRELDNNEEYQPDSLKEGFGREQFAKTVNNSDYYKNQRKQLAQRQADARYNRLNNKKEVEKKDDKGNTTTVEKEKNIKDKAKDLAESASASAAAIKNQVNSAKAKAYQALHPIEAEKAKIKAKIEKQKRRLLLTFLIKCWWLLIPVILVFIILIILAILTSGFDQKTKEYSDPKYDFTTTKVQMVNNYSSEKEVIKLERINLNEFAVGAAYVQIYEEIKDLDQSVQEAVVKAYYLVIKTRGLAFGSYSNETKNVEVKSTYDEVPYINSFIGGYTVKENGDKVYFTITQKPLFKNKEIIDTYDGIDDAFIKKLYDWYFDTESELIVPIDLQGGMTSLSPSDAPDYDDGILKDWINQAKGGSGYQELISGNDNFDNYKLYDKDNISLYYEYSTNGGNWWPIGSYEPTEDSIYGGDPSTLSITSPYGPRDLTGSFHSGIDIGNTDGICMNNVIIAMKSGTVTVAEDGCPSEGTLGSSCGGGYGNWVTIDHGDGIQTIYGHMTKGSLTVKVGDQVDQGQKIGLMGSSGSSTGCHLHFGVKVNGSFVNPMDYVSVDNPRPVPLSGNITFVDGGEGMKTMCLTLKASGYSDNAIGAVMTNTQHESGFVSTNLQNDYESSLGYSDSSYTSAVDSGSYGNFVNDSAGYGLAQWTYWSRKKNLIDYAKGMGSSIGDIKMQIEFLQIELRTSYTGTYYNLQTNSSTEDMAEYYCLYFESPATPCSARRGEAPGYAAYAANGCN